jgi:hypothetical protein
MDFQFENLKESYILLWGHKIECYLELLSWTLFERLWKQRIRTAYSVVRTKLTVQLRSYNLDLKLFKIRILCTVSVKQFYTDIQWKSTNLPHHFTLVWLFWNYFYDIDEWRFLIRYQCKTILHRRCMSIKLLK